MKAARSFLLIFFAASAAWAVEPADCHLVAGWLEDGPLQSYRADNLFEYLDGGAEGYLIFGFVRLQHQTCARGEASVVLDVSEMTDADAAYGLFAARRDPTQPIQPIGMGGEIVPRRASFAKGNAYVEITMISGDDDGSALRAFVDALEKRIQGRSAPPVTLAWFPPEGLTSVRLIPESVLGLRPLKRGYVADYSVGQAFIVTEVSAESAATVLAALRQRFSGATSTQVADEAFQFNDRYLGNLCIFRKGRHLGGYAHLRDDSKAVSLARTLASRLPPATQ